LSARLAVTGHLLHSRLQLSDSCGKTGFPVSATGGGHPLFPKQARYQLRYTRQSFDILTHLFSFRNLFLH